MLPNNPLVSIVLPTFNRSHRLGNAIESCLAQTYPHWELLIVDDGSTDGTAQLAQHYAQLDERIIYLPKPNTGLPRSLNYGFERVRGNLLTWTSDDNRFLPQALEKMVETRLQQSGPCLIYADYWIWNPDTDERKPVIRKPDASLANQNLVGACFLYDSIIQERIGLYEPEYFLVEDYEYWLRISCHFPLVHVQEPLYLYSMHPETLTSLRTFEIKALAWVVRRKYQKISDRAFVSAYRQNLSRLFRSDFTLARKFSTLFTIVNRTCRLMFWK